jgi:spoIIIJ-associated protein
MRDLVFAGATVEEAVRTGAAALGIEPGNLRYLVIDAGSPAIGKRAGQPARIAVLAERVGPLRTAAAPPSDPPLGEARLRARMAEIGEALSRACDEDVRLEVEDEGETVVIRVLVGDKSVLFSGQGGETFQALEHLLKRVASQATGAHRVVVSNPSYRAIRETALKEKAESLASAVRDDGIPRVMEKLTSYERRLVHMALSEVSGVCTRSEGEGSNRLLVIEPTQSQASPGA